jgi:ketosteroid isomerase-like protein
MGMNKQMTSLEVVQAQYAASAAGDLQALRATLADDIVWTEADGFPLAGTYYGPEGVTSNVMEKLAVSWDNWAATPTDFIVDGERVVTLGHYTARNKATGKPLRVRFAHSFTVRNGKIAIFEQVVDTALIRDAMNP